VTLVDLPQRGCLDGNHSARTGSAQLDGEIGEILARHIGDLARTAHRYLLLVLIRAVASVQKRYVHIGQLIKELRQEIAWRPADRLRVC
jgi:hypothetical protein